MKCMKRGLVALMALCLLLSGGVLTAAAQRTYPQEHSFQAPGKLPEINLPTIPTVEGVAVYANETMVPVAAASVGETVLLPLDETIKAFGGTATVHGDNSATIVTEKASFTLSADGKTLSWNEDAVTLNTPASMVEGVLYVPGQVFAEILDAKVWYSEALEMIVVSTGKYKDDNILRNIGATFWMNGEPYYEISFNKYDLAYQLAEAKEFNGGTYNSGSMWNTYETTTGGAEQALKDLSENGFKTIRAFCGHVNLDMKEEEVQKFWDYSDYMYDLCDKYGIRLVVNMGLTGPEFVQRGGYIDGKLVPAETYYDLITNPESKSRQNVNEFLEQYINRYKDRDTVLMWEVVNEGALEADIGLDMNNACYSLLQLGQYYSDMNEQIKKHDPDHLLTSGDSLLRTAQWNLFVGVMQGGNVARWKTDTAAERKKALWLLNENLDALSVHGYGVGYDNNGGCMYYTEKKGTREYARLITWDFLLDEARALGLPLYNGECGGMMDENGKEAMLPNMGAEGAVARGRYLDTLVEAGVQLTHWWTYRADAGGKANLSTWSITLQDTPESFAVIKAANEELQARYMVNPLDADNTHTLSAKEGDGAQPYVEVTTAPDVTEAPTTEIPDEGGCASVLGGGLVSVVMLGGLWLAFSRKKK